MIKNICVYAGILAGLFLFSAFHRFERTTWLLFIAAAAVPAVSVLISLPFMIMCAVRGAALDVPEKIPIGGELFATVNSFDGKKRFFPQLRIKLTADNRFSNQKIPVKIWAGGFMNRPVRADCSELSEHCGEVCYHVNYCRVYDMLGLLFIPVRLSAARHTLVMPKPQRPELLPDLQRMRILGFRPKSGGGFSDYYELRPYRGGDSIKNIHWKISSKYDDLIVREPSLPVTRKLVIKPEFSQSAGVNDSILSRVCYAATRLNASGREVYCLDSGGGVFEVKDNASLERCIVALYSGKSGEADDLTESEIYTVSGSGEEVSDV